MVRRVCEKTLEMNKEVTALHLRWPKNSKMNKWNKIWVASRGAYRQLIPSFSFSLTRVTLHNSCFCSGCQLGPFDKTEPQTSNTGSLPLISLQITKSMLTVMYVNSTFSSSLTSTIAIPYLGPVPNYLFKLVLHLAM